VTDFPRKQRRRLLTALEHCEDQLRGWTSASEANRSLFDDNPAAALEAADLQFGLDRDTMMEFETVLRSLARKLELYPPDRVA
jgi:hypothetical protein